MRLRDAAAVRACLGDGNFGGPYSMPDSQVMQMWRVGVEVTRFDRVEFQILLWGAGAIGGTVAAYLRRAGLDVAVVDANAAHVQATRERGPAITGPIETFTQPLPALKPDAVEGVRDIPDTGRRFCKPLRTPLGSPVADSANTPDPL